MYKETSQANSHPQTRHANERITARVALATHTLIDSKNGRFGWTDQGG